MVIDQRQARVYELAPRREIELAVTRLLWHLQDTSMQAFDAFLEADSEVVRVLLGQVDKELGLVSFFAGKKVIVIPDGVLYYLPFEALLFDPVRPAGARGPRAYAAVRPHYWLSQGETSFSYVPSASALAHLAERRALPAATSILGVYNINYSMGTVTPPRWAMDIVKSLRNLASTEVVAEILEGWPSAIALRAWNAEGEPEAPEFQSTEDNFCRWVTERSPHVMLFAGHATYNDKCPSLSGLIFNLAPVSAGAEVAPGSVGAPDGVRPYRDMGAQDGFLRLERIGLFGRVPDRPGLGVPRRRAGCPHPRLHVRGLPGGDRQLVGGARPGHHVVGAAVFRGAGGRSRRRPGRIAGPDQAADHGQGFIQPARLLGAIHSDRGSHCEKGFSASPSTFTAILKRCHCEEGAQFASDEAIPIGARLGLATDSNDRKGDTKMANRIVMLSVGVGEYEYPGVDDLALPPADALAMAQAIIGLGSPEALVKVLLDGQATKANMQAGLAWLADNAGADDLAVFYFSGHGARFTDQDSDELDNYDEFLCPVDTGVGGGVETLIRDDELHEWIQGVTAKTKQFVLMFDSCHSGGAIMLGDAIPRELPAEVVAKILGDYERPKKKAGFNPDWSPQEGHMLLAAAEPQQSSYEFSTMDNGLFTTFVLAGIADAAITTFEGLFEFAKAEVVKMAAEAGIPQTPHLIARVEGDLAYR
jgi:hypothetical protein